MADTNTVMIISAVIGGFMSAGAGVLLDIWRERKREARTRALLTTAICDDLKHSVSVYNKLQNEWLERKVIFYSFLNELKDSRQTYINNKDWVHMFDDAALRRDIFEYYLKSSDCISSLEYNQTRRSKIENKFNETKTTIQLKDPNMTDFEVNKMALQSMVNENIEYQQLEYFITESISDLFGFKEMAMSIVERLGAK